MTLRETDGEFTDTAMAEAFERAGVEREETPQQAFERIWKTTRHRSTNGNPKHDPVETMRLFKEWVEEKPERFYDLLLPDLRLRVIRLFLERAESAGGSKIGCAFRTALRRHEVGSRYGSNRPRVEKWNRQFQTSEYTAKTNMRYKIRKKLGLKAVHAEVDITTGTVVNLIDKEYGPFAHIRIGKHGRELPDVTTDDALAWCDKTKTDVRFIRALCHLIPDPRKPIGEQWSAEMIRTARETASRCDAA